MKRNILKIILITFFSIAYLNANPYPGFEENKKACERGDAKACYDVAQRYDDIGISMYQNYERVPIDYNQAEKYYKEACDLGNSDGCSSLVLLYFLGKVDPIPTTDKGEIIMGANYFKANKYMAKGCKLGDAGACTLLGISYSEGSGIKQNYVKANDLFVAGCKKGDGAGCYFLGMSYKEGKGVKKDIKKAKKLFGLACDMKDDRGCKEYSALNK